MDYEFELKLNITLGVNLESEFSEEYNLTPGYLEIEPNSLDIETILIDKLNKYEFPKSLVDLENLGVNISWDVDDVQDIELKNIHSSF